MKDLDELAEQAWDMAVDYISTNCPHLSSDRNAAIVIWKDDDISVVEWLGNSMPTTQNNSERCIIRLVREGDLDPCSSWTYYEQELNPNYDDGRMRDVEEEFGDKIVKEYDIAGYIDEALAERFWHDVNQAKEDEIEESRYRASL